MTVRDSLPPHPNQPLSEKKMARLTRSSTSSPRTRSSGSSTRSSPRTRSSTSQRAKGQVSPAIAARHRRLYPITSALLFHGTKAEMRRDVHRATADQLLILSPRPGPDVVKPTNWQGHDLTGTIPNHGIKTLHAAGAWNQKVRS